MIKMVLFDLDGTLLGMDLKQFTNKYSILIHDKIFKPLNISFDDGVKKMFIAFNEMVTSPDLNINNLDDFYSRFEKYCGIDVTNYLKEHSDSFYLSKDFEICKELTSKREAMIESIKILKEKGYQVAICTNPFFPKSAIDTRIRWAGLEPSDFLFVTYGENSHGLKPNLSYYQEVIDSFAKCKPEELLMVGNDVDEDMVSAQLGINTYLVKDDMISRYGREKEVENQGYSIDFLKFVKEKM